MSLNALSTTAASLLAAAGLALAVLALSATRELRGPLGILLDFLLGAGLLRLTFLDSWTAITSAAALVAIRKLVVVALTSDSRHGVAGVAAGGRPVGPDARRRAP